MPKTMNDSDPPEQNKRVGLHPMIVIFGVIIGLWLFVQAIIPKSKDIQPPQGNEVRSEQLALLLKEAESAPVPSIKVTAHVQGMNALSLLVPRQTTDSQVVALLNHLRLSRKDGSLVSEMPATTPGNNLVNLPSPIFISFPIRNTRFPRPLKFYPSGHMRRVIFTRGPFRTK